MQTRLLEGRCPCASIAVFAARLLIMPLPAAAAAISWGPASDTTGKADLIEGTVVYAVSGGLGATISGGGTGGTSTYTFTAASYADFAFTPVPGTRTSADISNGAPSTGDANFDTIVKSFTDARVGITSGTQTIGGLSRGVAYRIQVFFNDQRPANIDRIMTYGDGDTVPANVNIEAAGSGWGQYAVGTFTADGTTQRLTHIANGFGNVHVNAVLVAVVPGANLPPVFDGQSLVVEQSAPTGTVVGVLSATDTDGPNPVTYTITAGNDDNAFALNATTGELSVGGTVDYVTQRVYALTVEARDGSSATPATVTVHVLPSPGKAVITWEPPVYTTGKTNLVEGTIVTAFSGGTNSPTIAGGGAGSGTTYTFTGVSFTDVFFFATGNDIGKTAGSRITTNVYAPAVLDTTGDVDFDTVISSFTDSHSGIITGTLVLEGLTPGIDYRVQVFYNDQRSLYDHRVMTYGDGNGNTVNLTGGDPANGVQTGAYGQYAVGNFAAEKSTQRLTMAANGFGNVHFNAVVVTSGHTEGAAGTVLTVR